ncbi:YveK family protein [Liquorilactobacillus mali]|uniref:Capsular polysaccharide biosynthesis protein CpsC n=1 Tax=Liquorilactobacillus mali TaxID=1618 RepID=A0A0R2FXK3_9LACO|nr:Wzz/FepE/Etk N-terminal domain-containing protein [Liquorilactobacillus mali]KRN33113.1 Exopolysaccharide chain length regulator [Liquorilactobacillus mali]QFQ74450.1 chain-length determining protein [Liquorilactobacillus mali]
MSEEVNNETVIDLRRLFVLLKKNYLGIILWGIIGAIVAFIVSFIFMTPQYSASIDLLVNQKADNESLQYNVQQADLQAINTYEDVIKKPVILEPVVKELRQKDNYSGSVASLEKLVSISNATNSQVLTVTVTDTNAYTAADLANSIGKVFSQKIKKMMKVDNVTIVTKATANTTPVSPNKKLNLLIGVIVGLLIGVAIVVIKDLLDTTVRDEKFLTEELGLTSLGAISHIQGRKYRRVVNVTIGGNVDSEKLSRRRV